MKRFNRTAAVLLAIACSSFAATAQRPVTASATPPAAAAGHVQLDIVVTNKSGKPVADLQPQDFTILDNGHPTKILSFHSETGFLAPQPDITPEVILILDEVNAPYDRMVYARDGIIQFLRENNGKLAYPVSLGLLTDDGLQLETQPTLSGTALADALSQQIQGRRVIDQGQGVYGAEDQLKISMDALDELIAKERPKPNRKMIIWVSPGWPMLSGLGVTLSERQQQRIFQNAVRLSDELRQARITLYSVDTFGTAGTGVNRTTYYENFTKGLRKPDDAELGDLGLQVLADQTGGRALFGNATIPTSIHRCEDDLSAFYTVSIAQQPGDRPDDFHPLQVKLSTSGLKARTRNGYYAQP